MTEVVTSDLAEVELVTEPWTLRFRLAGIELEAARPLAFLTEPRWPDGRDPPPDEDPPELPAGAWSHLGGVEQEQGSDRHLYRASLRTDHPGTRRAEVVVSVVAEGVLSFRASVPGAAVCRQEFVARPGERWLGFGERSHTSSVDRGVIENYVGEGPYQPHEYPFLRDIVPPWGIRNRRDASYFPVPWVLSTRGYGVLVDRDEVSYWRFRTGAEDRWAVEVESGSLDLLLFAGPTPLAALGRFSAAVGRQPEPERWWFGPWYQSGHANHVPLVEERGQADRLQAAGAAVSAVETHCRYLPLGEDRGFEDEERARTEQLHSRGLAVLSYINPLVGRDYAEAYGEAESEGALMRGPEGETHLFQAYAGGREPPHTLEVQYDFTHPNAEAAWGAVAERITRAGYDGWMEDFGEYTPLDARPADGSRGTAAHNRYPTLYHRAADSVARKLERRDHRRLARFARSGWTGTAAVTPIVWGGDPTTSWGFDGLASAVVEALTMGASGVAMWGSDTGGFLSTLDQLTPELLIRWIQFSALCPVMRTKAGGIEIPAYTRPQIWDDDVLPHWVRWSRWHTRLNDYLMAAHDAYRRTGRPIVCPVELAFPDSPPLPDQYLLGPELLVAPVLEPGASCRRLFVPEGVWTEVFAGRRHRGPATVDVEAPLEVIPVLARAGAVMALLPDDVSSLSPYAPPVPAHRQVLAWPDREAGPAEGSLGPQIQYRASWQGDDWTLELSAAEPVEWEVEVRHPSGARTCTLSGAEVAAVFLYT